MCGGGPVRVAYVNGLVPGFARVSISRVSLYPLLQAPGSDSRLSCLGPSSIRHQDARMIVVVLVGPYRAYPLHFVDRRGSTPRQQKKLFHGELRISGPQLFLVANGSSLRVGRSTSQVRHTPRRSESGFSCCFSANVTQLRYANLRLQRRFFSDCFATLDSDSRIFGTMSFFRFIGLDDTVT